MSAAMQHERAIDQLSSIPYTLCDVYEDDPSFRCVGKLSMELMENFPELAPQVRPAMTAWVRLTSELIRRAQAEGDARPDLDPDTTAEVAVAVNRIPPRPLWRTAPCEDLIEERDGFRLRREIEFLPQDRLAAVELAYCLVRCSHPRVEAHELTMNGFSRRVLLEHIAEPAKVVGHVAPPRLCGAICVPCRELSVHLLRVAVHVPAPVDAQDLQVRRIQTSIFISKAFQENPLSSESEWPSESFIAHINCEVRLR